MIGIGWSRRREKVFPVFGFNLDWVPPRFQLHFLSDLDDAGDGEVINVLRGLIRSVSPKNTVGDPSRR